MSERSDATKLDRRQFLGGSTAAVALMMVAGSAVIHTTEAWGLETKTLKPETMRTLIKMARDIYPHDRLDDRYYAIACKPYDEKSASDANLKSLIDEGVAKLDEAAMKAHKAPYAAVPSEADRTALLKAHTDTPLFKKLRSDLVVSLYNQKSVWSVFGYEGESASKGGYLTRGFNDIDWL
jgi:hypothetical protein